MQPAEFVTVLLACGWLLVSVVGDGCPYQECFCDGDSILCENRGLTSLPVSFSTPASSLPSLILDTNQITRIPARSLPLNLREISLVENPIESIDDAAFDGSASTLDSLSFSNARFTRIPDALFHLRVLKHFIIYETQITDWNVDAMKHIGQTLESFYIVQYDLKTWPDTIQYLSHLTDLSVVSSSISTIPDNALDTLANSLVTLTLNNNSLTAVPKALSKLKVLEMVYLRENKIVDIRWLPQSNNMHSISLDNNDISDANQLSQVLRQYEDTLADIDIDHNQLTVTPDLSFLKQVADLDFSYNRISDPNSGAVPPAIYNIEFGYNFLPSIPTWISNLKLVYELTITSNKIREIRGTDIPQWIRTAQLDYNLISELKDTSFPENSSISTLNLNYNPLSQISLSAFKNLPLLTEIFMQGTQITRVPLALGSLTRLTDIDISNCTRLVCTCLEKSLSALFQKLNEYDISGNCGITTVYNFFINLSPACPTLR